jgi:chemotaxis protein CheD
LTTFKKSYYLKPAELYIDREPSKVITLLGTCIAVCLWDPALKVGGINHFMLPIGKEDADAVLKYGNFAIDILIKKMIELGSQKHSMKAKVFGGADNTLGFSHNSKIGQRNAETALEHLQNEKISILAQNTGGNRGRKIIFYTSTGDVYMKFLGKMETTKLI